MWGIILLLPSLLAGLETTTARKVAVSIDATVCTGVCVWWELGMSKHTWEVPRGMRVLVSVCAKTWLCPEILADSFTSKKGMIPFLPLYRWRPA